MNDADKAAAEAAKKQAEEAKAQADADKAAAEAAKAAEKSEKNTPRAFFFNDLGMTATAKTEKEARAICKKLIGKS